MLRLLSRFFCQFQKLSLYLLNFVNRLNKLKVEVNTALPGLKVQYTEKGKSNWRDVTSDTKMLPGTEIDQRTA